MESFVVSALKYRPLGFDEVVGQSHITTMLKNAIKKNHLGQALLFCGPRGVGKTTCARILAKTINGFEKEGSTSDFNIFELDAASHNSVEDIRYLVNQVRYPPQHGKYKVYIIDEVHMLSTQAFNAFLKTLEEPPEYTIFILATTEKHKIIPTILSRCQIYDFNRIEVSDIMKQLEKVASSENVEAEKEALHLIAQKADGALRDALSIFDLITTFSSNGKITYKDTIKNLHILDHDYYFKLVDDLLIQNMFEALILFDEVLKNGFDGNNFLNGLQQHLRNLLISKDEKMSALLEVTDNLKARYNEQASNCTSSFLLSALSISNQFELNFKQSKNQRLHVELCLMKLAHLTNALSLNHSISEKKNGKHEGDLLNQKEDEHHSPNKTYEKKEEYEISQKKLSPPSSIKESQSSKPSEIKNVIPPKSNPDILSIESPSSKDSKDTPSIFNKKKRNEETKNITSVIPQQESEFSQEDLQNAWKTFLNEKNDVENTKKYILNRPVKKGENHTIIISLDNPLEANLLEKFNMELVQYLRKKLQNDHIVICTEIAESEDSEKPYTNKDIFDYMAKKNPNLKDLKHRLKLDFEY